MAVMEITNDPAPGVALLIVQVASFFCGVAKIIEVAETVELPLMRKIVERGHAA